MDKISVQRQIARLDDQLGDEPSIDTPRALRLAEELQQMEELYAAIEKGEKIRVLAEEGQLVLDFAEACDEYGLCAGSGTGVYNE